MTEAYTTTPARQHLADIARLAANFIAEAESNLATAKQAAIESAKLSARNIVAAENSLKAAHKIADEAQMKANRAYIVTLNAEGQ